MHKKIISIVLALAVLVPAAGFAQTSTKMYDAAAFEQDLYFGMRNQAQVKRLQEFLAEQGFYSDAATGNYFTLTRDAVKKFQRQYGINPTGYFGPQSRDAANGIWIGDPPAEEGRLYIEPSEAELEIGEGISVVAMFAAHCAVGRECPTVLRNVDASFVSENPKIAAVVKPSYSKECRYSQTTQSCTTPVYNLYQVEAVSPGTTTVTATYRTSGKTYTAKMKVTVLPDPNDDNLPPVISRIKGPMSLKVGKTGTWTVRASDPEGDQLSYDISWGDDTSEGQSSTRAADSLRSDVRQRATFTHSYARAGTYTVVITVTDEQSLSAQASASVTVR